MYKGKLTTTTTTTITPTTTNTTTTTTISATKLRPQDNINPFNTGTHFYLEISLRFDSFIGIRKELGRIFIMNFWV
ncbi:hypothetical protein E2C01_080259 [Portunus trituberculatus]|uniref:Uncharacterized protein n=1 Tax=Portunus trituberculatus TaxID=210409 RepID=A0A5B7IJ66_PORTR|nr:hypothetical protein [Portunus trituberculatus]